jgi:hypothetical protein
VTECEQVEVEVHATENAGGVRHHCNQSRFVPYFQTLRSHASVIKTRSSLLKPLAQSLVLTLASGVAVCMQN